jgi:hypothetical protein
VAGLRPGVSPAHRVLDTHLALVKFRLSVGQAGRPGAEDDAAIDGYASDPRPSPGSLDNVREHADPSVSTDEVAEAIRGTALALLAVGADTREAWAAHREDPEMTTDLWYERQCLLVSQAVQMMATACGFETALMLGLFIGQKQNGRYPRPLQHAWLETPDGTIIDPTSAQMGLNECAIIAPSNEIHRHYRMRGWWREDTSA